MDRVSKDCPAGFRETRVLCQNFQSGTEDTRKSNTANLLKKTGASVVLGCEAGGRDFVPVLRTKEQFFVDAAIGDPLTAHDEVFFYAKIPDHKTRERKDGERYLEASCVKPNDSNLLAGRVIHWTGPWGKTFPGAAGRAFPRSKR